MKACVDCKWVRPFWGRYGAGHDCGRPLPRVPDRVRGTVPARFSLEASSERSGLRRFFGQDVCGPDALYWEAEPPLSSPPNEGSGGSKPPPPSR
jgi:hypothetical protein